MTMSPINDPRPFGEVLRDWRARQGLTLDQTAARLDWARSSVANALAGGQVRQERALRALMTLVDEGRA